MGTSSFLGTIAVSTRSAERRTNLTWLLLTGLDEASCLQPALDFAERQGAKPPQPQPRSYGPRAHVSLAVARSAVRSLPLDWQALLPRVSPWLATSSSRHWETYHFPSRQTVAAKGRFMASLFHREGRAVHALAGAAIVPQCLIGSAGRHMRRAGRSITLPSSLGRWSPSTSQRILNPRRSRLDQPPLSLIHI